MGVLDHSKPGELDSLSHDIPYLEEKRSVFVFSSSQMPPKTFLSSKGKDSPASIAGNQHSSSIVISPSSEANEANEANRARKTPDPKVGRYKR